MLKSSEFIEEFNREEIQKLSRKIVLIYRNYNRNYNLNLIKKIKYFCLKRNRKFYISNDLKLALNLSLDGLYIPSFNKSLDNLKYTRKKNFLILGSAHNNSEIKTKEKQGVEIIFLSPLFKTKNYKRGLNVIKFNILSKNSKH